TERRSPDEPAAPRARVLGHPRYLRRALDQRVRGFGAHPGGAADRRFRSKAAGVESADVADARRRSRALFAHRHGPGRVRGGILALPDQLAGGDADAPREHRPAAVGRAWAARGGAGGPDRGMGIPTIASPGASVGAAPPTALGPGRNGAARFF